MTDAIRSATPFVVPVAEKNATSTSECVSVAGVSAAGASVSGAFSAAEAGASVTVSAACAAFDAVCAVLSAGFFCSSVTVCVPFVSVF